LLPFQGFGILLSSGEIVGHFLESEGVSKVEERLGFGNGNFEIVKV